MARLVRVLAVVTFLLVCASTLDWVYDGVSDTGAATSADQGCVNQGADRRVAAPVVCGLQRLMSWKSEDLPDVLRIGNRRRTNVAIAWPPHLVINKRQEQGRWVMFRVGFRYDKNWGGYIFPTAALKTLDHQLIY